MMAPTRLRAAVLAIAALATVVIADSPIHPGFNYGTEKVRGVNLGGWLVLEPWITPSLFDGTGNSAIVDEYTFGQYQSKSKAQAALKSHWDSWITESDFASIAAAGLNHVRLPIGYWAFDVSGGEPYIQGQQPYMERAVSWAKNHGLNIIIDLHGAPGSQNGFDNSGRRGSVNWASKGSYVQRTDAIIKKLAGMYKDSNWVVIAPLNEPAGFDGDQVLDTVKQYWHDSYGNVRFPYGSGKQSNTLLLIHDAFQSLDSWSGFMTQPAFQGVAIDTHIYQVFSDPENQRDWSAHISSACSHGSTLGSFSKNQMWTIVGEWSLASTDCAKYLNGRGIGSRYDGSYSGSSRVGSCNGKTGSGSSFSSDYKTFLRKYFEAQTSSYERGTGWVYWTWRAENADDWSYQAGLKYGWIPKNPTSRQYPDIC